MPPFKSVPSLQSIILKHISHVFQKLCCDHDISNEDLRPVVQYFDILLPPQIQSAVCEKFLNDANKIIYKEMLNEKYLHLCTELHAEYLWIIYTKHVMPSILGDLDGRHIKSLKMNQTPGHYWVDDTDNMSIDYDYIGCVGDGSANLQRFLSSLVNLTSIKCSQVCDNNMLQLLSKTCLNLEEISIDMCIVVDDKGIFSLCGVDSSDVSFSDLRDRIVAPPNVGCKKLKNVSLEYTCTGAPGAAMLLKMCPLLEDLHVTPDVNFGDIFYLLHGTNPERYESIKAKYPLKTLNNYMELDEDILSLIVRTCPDLKNVTLRCNGVERKDRNLLANLLALRLDTLDVMNCSMPALLWYLKQRGRNIENLTIQHLSVAPMSLTFTRTHLQLLIRSCPNLRKFTLKLNNCPIQPDMPYSSFGSDLLHFTSLTHLTLEGLSFDLEDLSIFLVRGEKLKELHILILDLHILEDNILFDFLSSGCLQSLRYLFLYRPLLTLEGLKRLVKDCPNLHSVGPLSSWAIPKKDRESFVNEIRTKNWDLNVESTEMISMFHI